MARKQEDAYETKRLKSPDGTVVFYRNKQLHNWEGPALIPEGNFKKAEYYIHGIKHTKDQWMEALREFEELPWYKSTGGKVKEER